MGIPYVTRQVPETCVSAVANTLVLAAVFLAPASAVAAERMSGDQVIALMDQAMTMAKDQRFVHRIETREPGKAPRVLKIDVRIKGKNWRLVEFMEPGDLKGMRILTLAMDKMYVYLPAYRRVRRISGNAKEQGFMGTTYSHDEISIVTYAPTFKGRLLSETEQAWKVEAIRRPGQEFRHKKLVFSISKKYRQPWWIKYFNDKGELLKTETRKDYICQDKVCQPKTMRLTDHTRGGAWTEITCDEKEWRTNTGIKDRAFTVRELQRRSGRR